jgi:hypothetical protein
MLRITCLREYGLFFLWHKNHHTLPGAGWLGKTLLAAILSLIARLGISFFPSEAEPDFWSRVVRLVLVAMAGTGIYLSTLYISGQQEIHTILAEFRMRLARKQCGI